MNFKELFPLTAFINLDSRKDRLAQCQEEFKSLGISPFRKSGFVPENISDSYSRGVVGCLVSHYQILQAAYLLNQNVFIFEDDVQFINNTKENIDLACDELNNIDWDFFYLGGNLLKSAYKVSPHLARPTWCQSTVSYGINKNFLGKLLSYFDLNNITKPIDLIYTEDVINSCNTFITIPMLTVQRDSFSDIESRNVQYTGYLEKRYLENLKE